MISDFERIASHFNATARCRRSKDAKPQVQYEPGCVWIECQHKQCSCRTNGHGDESLTSFLAKWQERNG
jgi:hypothetical protein